jgi:hypothetical protein
MKWDALGCTLPPHRNNHGPGYANLNYYHRILNGWPVTRIV